MKTQFQESENNLCSDTLLQSSKTRTEKLTVPKGTVLTLLCSLKKEQLFTSTYIRLRISFCTINNRFAKSPFHNDVRDVGNTPPQSQQSAAASKQHQKRITNVSIKNHYQKRQH